MTIQAAHEGSYNTAVGMWAAKDGEWNEVPLGGGPTGWTRPDHWLPTNVGNGEQKIQVLFRVGDVGTPETEKTVSLMCQIGYVVDWGDGTAPESVASNVVAKHLYDPTTLTGPDLEPGYKQALVTATPQTGNLIAFSLNTGYYVGKVIRSSAIEVVVGPSTLTTFTLTATPILERVEFKSRLILTAGTGLFAACASLHEIVGELEITGTNASTMFNGCYMLEKHPTLTMPNVTLATNMFNSNYLMVEPPSFDTAQVVTWSGTFSTCRSLKRLFPGFSLSGASGTGSLFISCVSLEELPLLDTANVTQANSMFSLCSALKEVHLTSTALMTQVNTMFNACSSMRKVDTLNFAAVTPVANLASLFTACTRLTDIVWEPGGGPTLSFTLPTYQDAANLNATYEALPTTTGQTITVTSVPGTLGDDPSIATAKGWTVTGS
jgi:Mycoplasma protein of unknown function, DUF285